jgi:hypothetical protein
VKWIGELPECVIDEDVFFSMHIKISLHRSFRTGMRVRTLEMSYCPNWNSRANICSNE